MSQPLGMTIDAPSSVKVGEQFSYRLQPTVSSLPDKESIATTTDIQRLKIDWELPENTEFVGATVVAGTGITTTPSWLGRSRSARTRTPRPSAPRRTAPGPPTTCR
jgi:hypothetical protein